MVNFVLGTASRDPCLKQYGELKAKVILTLTGKDLLKLSPMERGMLRYSRNTVTSGEPVLISPGTDAAPLLKLLTNVLGKRDEWMSIFWIGFNHSEFEPGKKNYEFTIGFYG